MLTANPGGIPGDDAGFWVALMFRVGTQAVASATRQLARRGGGGTGGWMFYTTGTLGTLYFTANTAASQVLSPPYTIAAGDVGKIHIAVGVMDGSAVRLYTKRLEVGSGTAFPGTYAALADATSLGRTTAASLTDVTMFGLSGGHGVPALADIQSFYDTVKSGQSFDVAMPGSYTNERRWVCSSATTLTDSLGSGDSMTVSGSLSTVSEAAPTWTW